MGQVLEFKGKPTRITDWIEQHVRLYTTRGRVVASAFFQQNIPPQLQAAVKMGSDEKLAALRTGE